MVGVARMALRWGAVGMSAAVLMGGCGQAQPGVDGGPRVSVRVGSLSYEAVTDAAWTIEVFNGDPNAGGELVVTRSDVRSTRFGNGSGAISYVAPCDAQTGQAVVRLTLDAIHGAGGVVIDPTTWRNPTPVQQSVTCTENADTPVVFNITIVRDARQGFFDVGVSFSSVFCSAKFDCVDDNDAPLKLLHDQVTLEREQTMVMAFACTSGADRPTWLHMTDVHVVCDGADGSTTNYWLSPQGTQNGHEGNQGPVAPVFFQTGLYHGREQLPGVEKCYWNQAFGVATGAPANCRLIADATASETSWRDTFGQVPENGIYPYIHFEIPFTDGEGRLACGRHPVNGSDGRVTTRYTGPASGAFAHEMACATATLDPDPQGRTACDANLVGQGPARAVFTQTPSGVSAAFGASRGPAYTLGDNLTLGGCCVSPCCAE